MKSVNIPKMFGRLKSAYPDARCELNFKTPIQLLVASILSAQCTDKKVNEVTPALFKKYKTAKDYAKAKQGELEKFIKSTGFYKQKAKSVIGCCNGLVEKFGGRIPKSIDDMVTLPGVGRKTASLVLGHAFGLPAIPVDTHAKRVSYRTGLTDNTNPEKIEQDLMKLIPKKNWTEYATLLVIHGRRTCVAKKPRCGECCIEEICPKRGVR